MIRRAAQAIKSAKRVCAFTGAGISVESGIPPFRGPGGLWQKYNPDFIEISNFHRNPQKCWKLIREIFYDFFGKASPNDAHKGLARLEEQGLLHSLITQNIDNLHQMAGSKTVHEFHGTAGRMICLDCKESFASETIDLSELPPECPNCSIGRLKPDFIFFGEAIPEPANSNSFAEADLSDVFLVIGTTGEVMPACMIPHLAKRNGSLIIEINPHPSAFTAEITDIFLQGPATSMMNELLKEIDG
ncbi:MAG: NAD-dependent deacylase [Candidatus Riflebacteria bacterium]